MVGLPETIDGVEIGWVVLNLLASAGCALAWRWARQDLAYVRRSERRHLARHFGEDVSNARGRMVVAGALLLAGILAMTQPSSSGGRTLVGWTILGLLYTAPLYLLWRSIHEATSRRQTVSDVARQQRNGGPR